MRPLKNAKYHKRQRNAIGLVFFRLKVDGFVFIYGIWNLTPHTARVLSRVEYFEPLKPKFHIEKKLNIFNSKCKLNCETFFHNSLLKLIPEEKEENRKKEPKASLKDSGKCNIFAEKNVPSIMRAVPKS